MDEQNTYETFKAGERIITIGDPAVKAYMVVEGKVRVYIEKDTKEVDLAVLEKDAIFGETAIFSGEAYGANVDAKEDCELMVITPETMNDMLKDANPIIRALIGMLIERLRNTNDAFLKSETREFMDIGFV